MFGAHRATRTAGPRIGIRAGSLALLTLVGLLALSSGNRVQASAPASDARTFSFVPGTDGQFTIPPLAGYRYREVTEVEGAGGKGGDGAHGAKGGYSETAETELGTVVSTVLVIVGTNGGPGDQAEMSPAPGGQPGGGSGAPGGGGGGGYSAVCPAKSTPPNSCYMVAGGGGGGGDKPQHASGGTSSFGGSTGTFPVGTHGNDEGGAGGGAGGMGVNVPFGVGGNGKGGRGGAKGMGDGAAAGEPGTNGSAGSGGNGGFGTSGGGGGGGGGGAVGGGGGGGGGSCGADQPNCFDGHAGGGGGAAGSSQDSLDEQQELDAGYVLIYTVYFNNPPAGVVGAVQGAVQSQAGAEGPAVSVGCRGPSSTTCGLSASITTSGAGQSEDVDGSRARARPRGKPVLLGQASITLVAGQRQKVVLGLDDTGLALLHRHHRLAARLTVTQRGLTGKLQTIVSRKLTLTLAGKSGRH